LAKQHRFDHGNCVGKALSQSKQARPVVNTPEPQIVTEQKREKRRSLDIADMKLIEPPKFADHPGSSPRRDFAAAGLDNDFIQDSHSLSAGKRTLCGLHFQTPPFAQNRLMHAPTRL